jgi:hypothetical protein
MASFLISLAVMVVVIGGAGRWAQLKQSRLAAAKPDTEEV